jgi:hypothetical protein
MEVLVVILAVCLVMLGIYGALPLVRSLLVRVSRQERLAVPTTRSERSDIFASLGRPEPRGGQTQVEGLFSEVDLLRAQVQHLRSELVAYSGTPRVDQRPRLRRYGIGLYTRLPRVLRRQVREIRSTRHPIRV